MTRVRLDFSARVAKPGTYSLAVTPTPADRPVTSSAVLEPGDRIVSIRIPATPFFASAETIQMLERVALLHFGESAVTVVTELRNVRLDPPVARDPGCR